MGRTEERGLRCYNSFFFPFLAMLFVDMKSMAFPLAVNSESLVLHLFPEHVSSKPALGTY